MKRISLTQGKEALVDDQDYLCLKPWTWFYTTSGYAARNGPRPKKTAIQMHKVIAARMGLTGEVDHRNQNKLDNRRGNLRAATRPQNQWNKGPQKNNTSGAKNVSLDKATGKYAARVKRHGKQIWLGRHATRDAAKKRVLQFIAEHDGEFACFNIQGE
jgi:hypothetical protein